MGLFGHDDEEKQEQPQDQAGQGAADNGTVPTDNGGVVGGPDDVQGAVPPVGPAPEDDTPVAGESPLPPEEGAEEGDDQQTPPAAV